MFYNFINSFKFFWQSLIIVCVVGIGNIFQIAFSAEIGSSAEKPPVKEFKSCGEVNKQSIDQLQFERTAVAEKIYVIDRLSELADEKLQECFRTSTDKELVGLTILELSRHTDGKLAEKAQALEKRFDLKSYVDKSFSSESEVPEDVVDLLLRIEPTQAKVVLDRLSPEKKTGLEEIMANYIPVVLIPTGSEGGDRYYVKIIWDKENKEQVDCLAKFFHEELLNERSVEEEKQVMQKLDGKRWIYWYKKEWAIAVAHEVIRCGAESSFVNGLKPN